MRAARSMRISLAVLAVGAAAGSASAAFGHHAAGRCTGTQLAGAFSVVRGSGAAGSISYKLTLKNTSAAPCTLTGVPEGRLLGKAKQKLPTHASAAHPGMLTAILVTIAPGDTTYAIARFSPDVPGAGAGRTARCEPTAYWFRVGAQGGGTTTAEVVPPVRPGLSGPCQVQGRNEIPFP